MQIIGISNIKGGVGKTTTAVNLAFLAAAEGWTDLTILPFFSMVDRRRSLHEQVIAEARSRFPSILECEIPYWSEIERMSVRRAPLPAFAPRSPAADIYVGLWKEIEARLSR